MTIVRRMSLVTIHGWKSKTKAEKTGEGRKFSLKSSIAIAYISTILLWWLPIFGPMISGYVSGRAAGTKWKGLFSTAIVALTFGVISFIISYKETWVPTYLNLYFNSSILNDITHVSPFVGWLIYSLEIALTNFNTYVFEKPPNWEVLIVFGFLGGAMSELAILNNERKSILAAKHPKHKDNEAVKPKVVEYEPADKPHPLIKKVFKEKERESPPEPQSSSENDEYI